MPDLQLGTIDSFILLIEFHCFSFFKLFVFILRFFSHFLLIKSKGESRIKTLFESEKRRYQNNNNIRIRFQGYRCKSRITICTLETTLPVPLSKIFANIRNVCV